MHGHWNMIMTALLFHQVCSVMMRITFMKRKWHMEKHVMFLKIIEFMKSIVNSNLKRGVQI